MPNVINNENGLSLIELMIVVTIIAIMVGFAALGMDIIHRERVSSTTKEMYANLQKARLDGMATGPTTTSPLIRGAGIKFQSSTRYVTFTFDDCSDDYAYQANTCAGSKPEEANAKTISMPSGIEMKIKRTGPVADPNNDIVIFDRLGYPRSSLWEDGDITLIVRHQTAGYSKCIHVSTNRIREGSWDGTNCVEE